MLPRWCLGCPLGYGRLECLGALPRMRDDCLEVCVGWLFLHGGVILANFCFWNELLVLPFWRHRRWKHSATVLLKPHLTRRIGQIPCFVGQGSFPRSTQLVVSVRHRLAALHQLEILTAKRLLYPGCCCCFGFSWGIHLVRWVRQSFFPITRRWFEPN